MAAKPKPEQTEEIKAAQLTDEKPEQEQPEENSERLIYCGPNLPGGVLFKYQVFKGGYPVHLKEVFESCPAVKALFVPVSELNQTRINKDKAGTYENKLIRDIEKYIEGGAK